MYLLPSHVSVAGVSGGHAGVDGHTVLRPRILVARLDSLRDGVDVPAGGRLRRRGRFGNNPRHCLFQFLCRCRCRYGDECRRYRLFGRSRLLRHVRLFLSGGCGQCFLRLAGRCRGILGRFRSLLVACGLGLLSILFSGQAVDIFLHLVLHGRDGLYHALHRRHWQHRRCGAVPRLPTGREQQEHSRHQGHDSLFHVRFSFRVLVAQTTTTQPSVSQRKDLQ